MAEPLTWLVINAIAARLAQITVSNGFASDLGLAPMYMDRSQRIEEDSGAFALILAGEIPTNEESSGHRTLSSDMNLTIEFAIPAETENAELIAHRGRSDIVNALRGDPRGMPAGLRSLVVTGTQITSAPAPGSDLVIAQVSARAGLTESLMPA